MVMWELQRQINKEYQEILVNAGVLETVLISFRPVVLHRWSMDHWCGPQTHHTIIKIIKRRVKPVVVSDVDMTIGVIGGY